MKQKKLPPIHPGQILFEEFLQPMGISQYRIAKDTNVPPRRINEIVHSKRATFKVGMNWNWLKINWKIGWEKRYIHTRLALPDFDHRVNKEGLGEANQSLQPTLNPRGQIWNAVLRISLGAVP
jgi:hypothetical protein